MKKKKRRDAVDEAQVTNDAESLIEIAEPYYCDVTIEGVAPLLYHAWSVESVEEKSKAVKGSKTKKTDDLESYVYRTPKGTLGIAGKVFRGALVEASKSIQDPRSPRKSARDLVRASVICTDIIAPFSGKPKTWDYLDKQRVTIQRSSITRTRPAMNVGWKITFRLQVLQPEYITPELLHRLIDYAGKFAGLCDFRPTYGRFQIVSFNVVRLTV